MSKQTTTEQMTHIARLWLDNDEGIYLDIQDACRMAYVAHVVGQDSSDALGMRDAMRAAWSHVETHIDDLLQYMYEESEQHCKGLMGDLLAHAHGSIDCLELAKDAFETYMEGLATED